MSPTATILGAVADRRRLTRSVRFRVTAAATLAVGLVLLVGSLALVAAQVRQVQANLDRSLQQRGDDLEAELRAGRVPQQPATPRGGDVGVVQVVDETGHVVTASANVAGDGPIADDPPAGRREVFRSVASLPVDDDRFRILSRRVSSSEGPFIVHVAASADIVAESSAALRGSLLAGVPLLLVVLAGVTWLVVGRTLRPIEAIRAEVASIEGGERGRRVPMPAGDDEVARLATTMNAMLDRIDAAADRQQQFVADASHELRSPLTRMRTELEVDLAHPDQARPLETHRRVLNGIDRMQRLADDLLDLARRDAIAPARREVLDLDDVVLDEVTRARSVAAVSVDATRVSAAQVVGDRAGLARVVANLLDNAVRHASSAVRVELAEVEDHAVLAVADDGSGIAPADQERVFERFVRLDDARPADGRNGLGLAIVREVVGRHGGTVAVDPDFASGTRIMVTFPRSPVDEVADPQTAPTA